MTLSQILNPAPTSHLEVLNQYQIQYAASIESGETVRWVYPYTSFGPFLLILYLLLPPSKSKIIHHARYPLFAIITYLSVDIIRECRTDGIAMSYGIGLISAWGVLWSATLIIFNDARNDFQRIERKELDGDNDKHTGDFVKEDDSHSKTSSRIASQDQKLHKRHSDGHASTKEPKHSPQSLNQTSKHKTTPLLRPFYWQPLPPTLLARISWITDLCTNFRGTGWTYQISSLPPAPPTTTTPTQTSRTGTTTSPTPRHLLLTSLQNFALSYLALDILKYTMMLDPYFWGLASQPPPPYLPNTIQHSPALTKTYRLFLSLLGVHTPLTLIFTLAPLFLLLPHPLLGLRSHPFHYPSGYGSPKLIPTKGLTGFWGGWWHQLFRYAFQSAGDWLGDGLLGWGKRTRRGEVLRLIVAFACSACLHACGSYTMPGPSSPVWGSGLFFLLQPVGILIQQAGVQGLEATGLRKRLPAWVRGVGNVVFVGIWLFLVGGLFMDDIARAGIWLMEPVPFSILAWVRGERVWRWGGVFGGLYFEERWWRCGWAF